MLVELLVVILLMGVIGSVVTTSLVSGMQATMRGQERALALADLQRGADRVGRELRSGRPVLLDAHEASVDVFRNGQRQRYTYVVTSGGVLQETRSVWNNPAADPVTTPADSTVTRDVVSRLQYDAADPAFLYFDRSGGAVASPSAPYSTVDRIQMTLRRQLPQQPPLRLDTAVELRNTEFLGAN